MLTTRHRKIHVSISSGLDWLKFVYWGESTLVGIGFSYISLARVAFDMLHSVHDKTICKSASRNCSIWHHLQFRLVIF